MATAAEIKSYTKPELNTIYSYKLEIDTTPSAASPTWQRSAPALRT